MVDSGSTYGLNAGDPLVALMHDATEARKSMLAENRKFSKVLAGRDKIIPAGMGEAQVVILRRFLSRVELFPSLIGHLVDDPHVGKKEETYLKNLRDDVQVNIDQGRLRLAAALQYESHNRRKPPEPADETEIVFGAATEERNRDVHAPLPNLAELARRIGEELTERGEDWVLPLVQALGEGHHDSRVRQDRATSLELLVECARRWDQSSENAELLTQLEDLEAQVKEQIADARLRVVPIGLIKFGRDLAAGPYSAEDRRPVQRTLAKVIALIKQFIG